MTGARALRQGPGAARSRVARGRSLDPQGRGAAGARALGPQGQPTSDLASIAIEPNLWPTSAVIDWFDLLKRAPDCRERDEQLARGRADPALAAQLPGHDDGLLHRAHRLPVVADDLGRRERQSGAAGHARSGQAGARTCRAWCAAAWGGSSAATGTRRWPTPGACWRWRSSRAKFEKRAGDRRDRRGSWRKQERRLDWSKQAEGRQLMFSWPPGRPTSSLAQDGTGKPWATVQSLAAIPLQGSRFRRGYGSGARCRAVEQKTPGKWTRGDVMRVRLDLEAQSDMTWVVVNDPVPAGASDPRHGPGPRLADPGERRKEAGLGVAGVRGAQVRFLSRLLPLRAERQLDARVHVAPEQPGRVPAARDARRGDVFAGDVRGDPERRSLSVRRTKASAEALRIALFGTEA